MKQLSPEWTQNLETILKKEIKIYKDLLAIEDSKKTAIMNAEAKKIESLSQETQKHIQTASDCETQRMTLIEKIYKQEKLEQAGDVPVLSEFLNQIDRQSNFRLKGLANDLKGVVGNLKEKILINEKLLKTRHEIYSMSIDALKQASDIEMPSYEGNQSKTPKGRTSVLLNTQA